MSCPAATATLVSDDDRVRVTRFEFAPEAETGWHIHAVDYVIIAITPCIMRIQDPDGSQRNLQVAAGDSYRRDAGVNHNVINAGHADMCFVEVELK